MVVLGTSLGPHEHEHQLAAYCPRCSRWAVLPLAEVVIQGKGSLRLPVRVRCRECGERGTLQVRPPVPTRGPGGWMEAAPPR
jgi:DNA-directed RNA polymerase subunit RPC12/RpoP